MFIHLPRVDAHALAVYPRCRYWHNCYLWTIGAHSSAVLAGYLL